jgi:hypothetical protein
MSLDYEGIQRIPENWLDTCYNNPNVMAWIGNANFPESLHEMLIFVKKNTRNDRMIANGSSLPQSFKHWWCYVRTERKRRQSTGDTGEDNIPPLYPTIQRWKNIIHEHHNIINDQDITDTDVITVFITWMGQLYTDIVLFDNENGRATIPRLDGEIISLGGERTTRRETMKHIKKEGAAIFEERGFIEGKQYWNSLCTKYTI